MAVFFDIILYDDNIADGKSSDWDQPEPEAGPPATRDRVGVNNSTTVTGDTATDSQGCGDQDRLSKLSLIFRHRSTIVWLGH